jgi:hypothetical protein
MQERISSEHMLERLLHCYPVDRAGNPVRVDRIADKMELTL